MKSKTLIIEANRKGKAPPDPLGEGRGLMFNPKWRAASLMAKRLKADMVWQSPESQCLVDGGYDTLIFNRVLPGIGDNLKWLKANPDARVFHVTNDYQVLGGALYVAAKMTGHPVHVLSNYARDAKKVPEGFVASWNVVNLNTLVYEPSRPWKGGGSGAVYYGAFRKERIGLVRKYFNDHVTIASFPELVEKFRACGATGPETGRPAWWHDGLYPWRAIFYMENEGLSTPHFSNRFYEGLSYGLHTIVPVECEATARNSGYRVPSELVINSADQMAEACRYEDMGLLMEWREQATQEQHDVLGQIACIVGGGTA